MSGNGTDPNTCNQVPVVSPFGGNFSARLGNDNINNQAEKLRYSFVVTPNSTLFTYQYAVVFEDPGHIAAEQPRFETLISVNGITIPCTQYTVTAASNLTGFQTCPGIDSQGDPIFVTYRNWTTVGVNLTPYIGQVATAIFRTGDCSLGGHFEYSYIDAISCRPMELAPGQYPITLIAVTELGCSDTITSIVNVYPIPVIIVDSPFICLGESVQINATGAQNYTWNPSIWLNTNIGSSVISTPPVTITYTVTGIDSNGCIGTGTGTVTVVNPPSPPPNISHN